MKTFLKVWLGIGLISIGFGVALLAIAFASGASWDDTATFTTINESYKGVESIDIDISYGKVNIENGETFSVSAENILEGELESYVESGIWYVKEDESAYSNFFGIDFPVRSFFNWGEHSTPNITITIPEDFVSEDFTLKVSAGSVVAKEVNAVTGKFEVDAGRMEISQLTITDSTRCEVGTGEMILKDVNANDVTADCGVGNMEIDGVISGKNRVTCDIGNVDLVLDGDAEDYSYQVSCDIGNIEIDGKSYKGIDNKSIEHNNADNSIYLECDIGKINVEFN